MLSLSEDHGGDNLSKRTSYCPFVLLLYIYLLLREPRLNFCFKKPKVLNSPGKEIASGELVYTISACKYIFTHSLSMAFMPKFKRNVVMWYFILGACGNPLCFFLITNFSIVWGVLLMGASMGFYDVFYHR